MNYGSMTGGNFRTLGIVKKELADSKLVSDNLESASFNFSCNSLKKVVLIDDFSEDENSAKTSLDFL